MEATFFGVMTQSHRYLAIPEEWLQFKENKTTKIFYSPNPNDPADFDLEVKYFFSENTKACYNAVVIRPLSKCIVHSHVKHNQTKYFNPNLLLFIQCFFNRMPSNQFFFESQKETNTSGRLFKLCKT